LLQLKVECLLVFPKPYSSFCTLKIMIEKVKRSKLVLNKPYGTIQNIVAAKIYMSMYFICISAAL
jgi:hypothetical protein